MSLRIPTKILLKKKPKIIDTVESNYRIIRRVYQSFCSDIADIFFQICSFFRPRWIQGLDQDIKSNGWGVKNVLDIENALDFLAIFQSFYHNTGRFLLTNGLLIVPDSDAIEKKKLTWKICTKCFSIRILMVLCIWNF